MKEYVMQIDILEMDKELQSKKVYGSEDSDVARMCLSLLKVGVKKDSVFELAQPIKRKKFNDYWRNLKNNGYFGSDKRVKIESLDESDIPFVLMLLTATGRLERISKES